MRARNATERVPIFRPNVFSVSERDINPPESRSELELAHLAVLNIMDDMAEDGSRLAMTQDAMMNLLADAHDDKQVLEMNQKALINILEDAGAERSRLDNTHRAMVNILEDALEEKQKVEMAQTAVINILEDLEVEQANAIRSNRNLARSNAELEQFAYVTSHDLSEPLRAISGPLSLLARRYRGRLDEEADQFIEFAVDGCTRMQAMIDDLLLYSRAGRSEEPSRSTDASQVMGQVLAALAPAIAELNAELNVSPLPAVFVNPVQLGQVLQNLVSNALKFVPPGVTPVVSVDAEPAGRDWRFRVSDNGIGVAPRHRDRVWGMFKRLHARDEYPGTGIGLALVHKIVERHGGRIGIEDGPFGVGSTFWFTLPSAPSGLSATTEEGRPTC